ncbi:hypothetical protein DW231_06160 [Bifidobacterium pseudocatenulatum]|nr:hypothetical protein DW231_06160 [Bifidobacterium pseudocatenulatum]
MQKRALAHVHEKDVRQRAFFMIHLWARWVHSVSRGDGQQTRCRMLHLRLPGGYVFGLVLSVSVLVLSFFLKEECGFRK